ncbi:MAG: tripartite tricarboxylate transporter substrate-binding protein [Burkholderiales bacterium]
MNFATRGLLAACAALWLGAAVAQQSTYPTKSIRLIVAFQQGESADVLARAMVPLLSERLRQQVVIENRPGMNGSMGIETVAKSAPDGYTIGLGGAGALATNASLYPKMPYDPVKDLAPVTSIASFPFLLIANPKLPAATLADVIALARAKPGELLIGFGGNGTMSHLAVELFKLMARVQMVNVPYKSDAAAATDAVNGKLQLALVEVGAALPSVKAGKLKAIAVTNPKRVFALPDAPTFAEAGLPGFAATDWLGIVVPAATPDAIVARLNADFVATMKRAEVRDRIIAAGAEPVASSAVGLGALIGAEVVKWSEVVQISGARAD